MSKVQSIADRLLQINGDVFQELCDSFLVLRNSNYKSFVRSGSVPDKQKTRKGTPDSFMLLPNGRYLFLEATTYDPKKLFQKLVDDVKKCFDTNKTSIPKEKIREIVLCFNSNLTLEQTNSIQSLINEYNEYTELSIYGLDRLSTEIAIHHRNLAREYLDLPLDSGQLVSLDQFVDSYNKSSQRIATPLDNEFKHRADELSSLKESLLNHDLLILSGPPGVGKTRLAIEAVRQFLKEHLDYDGYAIANRDTDISEDLSQYISSSSKTVLFVDDVNRYDRFSQVLGFFQYAQKLKLIMTVRDYALSEVEDKLMAFHFHVTHLDKFTDEEIKEIIETKPFEILNTNYHNKIFEIADGNPRLAIMSALLAKKKNRIEALYDVSDLFDQYFSTYIQDKDAFKSDKILKTLGIVSFFYTIPYNDDKILQKIVDVFKISKHEFVQGIDELEKLELVQIRFEHVKIGEQNVSTFFFYKVFVKDKILPFSALLENYFFSMTDRFKDTVIPANNTFGYERVMENLESDLKTYWITVASHSEENAFKYLNHFWFYLYEECITFLFDKIDKLPTLSAENYVTKYGNNDFSYNKNGYIEILGEMMRFQTRLKDVLQLSFEYVRKQPKHLPELIKKLDTRFSIGYEDESYGLQRHLTLLTLLEEGISKGDDLISRIFLAISKNFLKFQFEQIRGARGNAISISRYPLQFFDPTKEFRRRIWGAIDVLFYRFSEECFDVLMFHQREHLDFSKEIFISDLEFVLTIVEKHLRKESYKHCEYIHELVDWSVENDVSMPEFDMWIQSFTNKEFEWLRKSNWDRFGRRRGDRIPWQEFNVLKEKEVRKSLVFDTHAEFDVYLDFLIDVNKWELYHHKHGLLDTLDIILDESFRQKEDLAYEKLESAINKLDSHFFPYRTIRNLASSNTLDKFWEFLSGNQIKDLWKIEFLCAIPEEAIDDQWLIRLYDTYDNLSEGYLLSFTSFNKYHKLDDNLYENLLKRVLLKIYGEGLKFSFGHDFFSEVSPEIADLNLLKKAYLYQQNDGYQSNSHYDHDGSELKILLERDPNFFIEYIEGIFSDGEHHSYRENHELVAVWSLENYTEALDSTLSIIIEKDRFHTVGQHFMNVFFISLKNHVEEAGQYLLRSIEKFNTDPVRMSIIIDIISNNMNQLYDKAFSDYLSYNQDLELFRRINWHPSKGVTQGDINFGDMRVAQWSRLKAIVEDLEPSYKLIPIKKFISDQIEMEKRHGDLERKRKFLRPGW